MACAKTRPSRARSQSAIAGSASPTTTGMIWVRDGPAPARPQRPDRMRLVDEQPAAVAAGELVDLGDRGYVAVHREDRVGDDQRRAISRLAEPPREVFGVTVAVHKSLGTRDPAAV